MGDLGAAPPGRLGGGRCVLGGLSSEAGGPSPGGPSSERWAELGATQGGGELRSSLRNPRSPREPGSGRAGSIPPSERRIARAKFAGPAAICSTARLSTGPNTGGAQDFWSGALGIVQPEGTWRGGIATGE